MGINRYMKYIITTIFLAFISAFNVYAGPRYDPNEPDLGLPGGSELGIGLLVAIFALPIGYFMLKSSDNSKSDGTSAGGCFGMILMGVGFVGLIPLIAWICAIGQVLIGVGIAIVVSIAIFSFLFGKK